MTNLKVKIQNLDKKSDFSNSEKEIKQNKDKNLLEIQINPNIEKSNNNLNKKKDKNISLLNNAVKTLNSNYNYNSNFSISKKLEEKKINDGRHSTKVIFYIRQISTDKKYKYQGVEKMTVTFILGEYVDILPSFIFGNKHFSFTPHHCYQLANKNRGYIISFDRLIEKFKKQLVANDQKDMYTYLFKQKRGKQIGIDIKKKILKH